MAKKELVLETTDTGCIVPISHKLNKDGYFRKVIGGEWVMYHRHKWIETKGEIPEGYEINHLCKNRACCNVDHLECITKEHHIIETNSNRYKKRKLYAKAWWTMRGCSGVELAEVMSVSFSTACRWIREWKV